MTTATVVNRALVIERTKDLSVKDLVAFTKELREVIRVEREAAKCTKLMIKIGRAHV